MERLKEIISNNYTSDFPEGVEIENQEEYMKTVRKRTNKREITVIVIILLMTKLMM